MRVVKLNSSDIQDEAGISSAIREVLTVLGEKPVVFVPAMGRTTLTLLEAGKRSAEQDLVLASALAEGSRTYHMQLAQQLTSDAVWKETRSYLSEVFEELSDLLKGLYLLGRFDSYGESVVASYAERVAVIVISEALRERQVVVQPYFSREVFLAGGGSLVKPAERDAAEALRGEIHLAVGQGSLPLLPASLLGAVFPAD